MLLCHGAHLRMCVTDGQLTAAESLRTFEEAGRMATDVLRRGVEDLERQLADGERAAADGGGGGSGDGGGAPPAKAHVSSVWRAASRDMVVALNACCFGDEPESWRIDVQKLLLRRWSNAAAAAPTTPPPTAELQAEVAAIDEVQRRALQEEEGCLQALAWLFVTERKRELDLRRLENKYLQTLSQPMPGCGDSSSSGGGSSSSSSSSSFSSSSSGGGGGDGSSIGSRPLGGGSGGAGGGGGGGGGGIGQGLSAELQAVLDRRLKRFAGLKSFLEVVTGQRMEAHHASEALLLRDVERALVAQRAASPLPAGAAGAGDGGGGGGWGSALAGFAGAVVTRLGPKLFGSSDPDDGGGAKAAAAGVMATEKTALPAATAAATPPAETGQDACATAPAPAATEAAAGAAADAATVELEVGASTEMNSPSVFDFG
jgi:hypothetical protein